VAGYEDKRIYVWFEAVIGYLSAAKEWAQRNGTPDAWREFWQNPTTKMYYFVGKDNIPFHTIIWPAILMGVGDLNLPYDVPANQYVTFKGQRASTSRNWAPWVSEYLERYGVEPIRYYLSANMPETTDTDFTDAELVRRNNDELVATWGNLVHRVLTSTYRNFDRRVPEPGPRDPLSEQILAAAGTALETVASHLAACRFKAAIGAAMAYATQVNRYLDERAPWRTIKEDRLATATTLHTAIAAINALKVAFYPFLPFASQRLHTMLGFAGDIAEQGWQAAPVPAGQLLQPPQPLFRKLELAVEDAEATTS
jgi:methionyl-tRNA synthetase